MNFAVKTRSNGGKARTGILQLSNCPRPIETPSLLLSTCKGLPFHISPDHLHSLPSPDSSLLQFSPLQFLEGPSPKTISKIGGLHQMLGLNEYGFVALPGDSVLCLPESSGTNKFGACFETPSGRHLVKPVEYVEMISSMKPNLWVALADEVPAWASQKRNKTSVDRTIRWLDECIAFSPVDDTVFGAIVGGSGVLQRSQCAREVAARNVSGYWIGGLGVGMSRFERPALLNAVIDELPEEKPRLFSGSGHPEEVLQGVAAGIDLFSSAYINHLTLGGFAITFQLDGRQKCFSRLSSVDSDPERINLRATIYRKDTSSIVDGCSCYTCRNHTKAYINHLLNVREMLAQTLLEMYGLEIACFLFF